MGMFDEYNVFPTLKTKKIIVGADNNITIRGLLSTKESKENASTWLGTSRFTQYVKICFVAIPEKFLQRMAPMFDSSSRFIGQRTFTNFERDYKTVSISLDEVLQNDYASTVGESDLGSDMMVNDLYFEVQLDMNQKIHVVDEAIGGSMLLPGYWDPNTRYLRNEPGFNSWHLIGFIHFDYEKFQENYAQVRNLNMLGGNATIDKLLEKVTSPYGDRYMKVPETTKAFFIAETWPLGSMQDTSVPVEHQIGEPYYGITHYHDGTEHENYVERVSIDAATGEQVVERVNMPQDPTPDYVGWMAGHPQDPGRGPKLSTQTVPYTKVIAPETIRAPVDNRTQAGSRYNGSPQGWFFESYDEDTRLHPPPTAREIFSDMEVKADRLGDQIKKSVEDFKRQAAFKRKKTNSNILFRGTAAAIRVIPAPSRTEDARQRVANTSCHQLVAGIDFEILLALHSPLGWLVEYHGSTGLGMNSKFVMNSKIKKLTVYRRRLTNDPIGNTLTSSPDYITYDNEEIPKTMVTTSEQENDNVLKTQISTHDGRPFEGRIPGHPVAKASISHVGTQDATIRGFYLEDYDLYHNVTFGNYEYTVEVHLIDGIKKHLERTHKAYHQAREAIGQYTTIAATPATFRSEQADDTQTNYKWLQGYSDPIEDTRTSEVVAGSYDFNAEDYTQIFKTTIQDEYRTKIDTLVDKFIDCYKVLEKSPLPDSVELDEGEDPWEGYRAQIIGGLTTRATPGIMEMVLDFMDNIAATLERVMNQGNINKYDGISSALLNPSLDISKEERIIHVKAKIPEMVKAFSRTQIFYEPDLGFSTWNSNS